MNETVQNETSTPENNGGLRGSSRYDTESGLTEIHESRLTSLAVRRGWLKGRRRATDSTTDELIRVQETRALTAREKVMLKTHEQLDCGKPMAEDAAMDRLVVMERQNQIDDLAEQKTTQSHVHLHQRETGRVAIYLPHNGRQAVETQEGLAADPDDPDDE